MIAPVDGSGSWPAWRQIVLNRARSAEFHDSGRTRRSGRAGAERLTRWLSKAVHARLVTIHLVISSKSTSVISAVLSALSRNLGGRRLIAGRSPTALQKPMPRRARTRFDAIWHPHVRHALLRTLPGRAIVLGLRRGSSSTSSAWCSAAAAAVRRHRHRRHVALIGAGYFVFRLRGHREAPPALARPPQADPVLHLHRLHSGAADRRLLPALRVSAVLQFQLLPRAKPAACAGRRVALPRAEHRAGDSYGGARRGGRRRRRQAAAEGELPGRHWPWCRCPARTDTDRAAGRLLPHGPHAVAQVPGAVVDAVGRTCPAGSMLGVLAARWGDYAASARPARRDRAGTHIPSAPPVSRLAAPGLRRDLDVPVTGRSGSGCDARRASKSTTWGLVETNAAKPLSGRDSRGDRSSARRVPARERAACRACSCIATGRAGSPAPVTVGSQLSTRELYDRITSQAASAGISARACCSSCSSSAACS